MEETPVTGEIIVTLASTERHLSYNQLGVTFESTDQEILDALAPVLLESDGFDIKEEQEEGYFTLKRVESSHNIFCFPKSVAGSLNP